MNHFFAISLPASVRHAIARKTAYWKLLNDKLYQHEWPQWYETNDFHITLKFLGDVSAERQAELVAEAQRVAQQTPDFRVFPATGGIFPNEKQPCVLWVGVRPQPELTRLAEALDCAMARHGFAADRRRFTPHITVARRKSGNACQIPVSERMFQPFQVDRFHLMQTLPPEARAKVPNLRYNIVQTFPFGNTH